MRPIAVALLARAPLRDVHAATPEELRAAYSDSLAFIVLDALTSTPVRFWRVDTRYFMDDAFFGPVVAIEDLRYSEEWGVYDVREWGENR